MNLAKDIVNRINQCFSDVELVKLKLEQIDVTKDELDRVIRCVLFLSDSDYDAIDYWVRTGNKDRRDLFYFAEYDNRNVRRRNFNFPFDNPENKG